MNREPAVLTVDKNAAHPVRLEQRWDELDAPLTVRLDARSVRDFADNAEAAQLEVSVTRLTPNRVSHRAGSLLLSDEACVELAAVLLNVDADDLRNWLGED